MFMAPTAAVNRETGELTLRNFGLKIEAIDDADKDTWMEQAEAAIARKVEEQLPEQEYSTAWKTIVSVDGRMYSLDTIYKK